MNAVPLITILLIFAAITAQAVAFYVTFRIRRRLGEKEDDEVNFIDRKKLPDENKDPPETEAQKPRDE